MATESIECDVVVIGGGPSGATAARRLAQSGKDVVLVEKDLHFHKPCGGGLILSAFDEFDLPKELIKKEVNSIKIVSPTQNEANVSIDEYPLTIVNRVEFDAKLRGLAVDAGAKLIEGRSYDIETADGVSVKIKTDNQVLSIKANYLIAADGVNSTIRRVLRDEKPSRILTQYVDISGEQSDSCQFWFGRDIAPGYYAWIFPHHDGLNAGLCVKDEKNIKKYMQSFLNKAGLEIGTGRIKGYFIPDWGREVYYDRSVFFVGDSASMVAPFTYEGIYYAMRSGLLAAEAIIADDPLQYEQRFKEQYRKKFKFLQFLQRVFLSNDWLSEKMVKFYQNRNFQKGVIGYWSGRKKPVSAPAALWKIFKTLVRFR